MHCWCAFRCGVRCGAVPFMQRGFCFGVGAVRCAFSTRSDGCRCFPPSGLVRCAVSFSLRFPSMRRDVQTFSTRQGIIARGGGTTRSYIVSQCFLPLTRSEICLTLFPNKWITDITQYCKIRRSTSMRVTRRLNPSRDNAKATTALCIVRWIKYNSSCVAWPPSCMTRADASKHAEQCETDVQNKWDADKHTSTVSKRRASLLFFLPQRSCLPAENGPWMP